jgi:DNA-directed RNA polymerase specialized sigma24 family protein
MQDVMEKALTRAAQTHPNPIGWFKAAVRNRYLDIVRAEELRKGAPISTPSGNYAIASIDEALSGVDWFDAEVFRLHYIHGVSVRAISYQIECPASTVYDAINKASNIVKQRLSL